MYKEGAGSLNTAQRSSIHTHGCAHAEVVQRGICTPLLFLSLIYQVFARVHWASKGELSVLDANHTGSDDALSYSCSTHAHTSAENIQK